MNARAATFRNVAGEIVGQTWGGTICWYPRKPSSFACVSEDGNSEHVIRCGWCPGCLELDRRRLADRLQSLFAKVTGDLWVIIVENENGRPAIELKRLRHIIGTKRCSGLYRLSSRSAAAIVVGSKPDAAATRGSRSCGVTLKRVVRSRGRRAWNLLTSGMLVTRDVWGEWRKRFYHRGLPRLERDRWNVTTTGGIRKRHAATTIGVRAWRGDVSLFPPVAWLPPRLVKRKGSVERRTRSPEKISGTLESLLDRLRLEPARFSKSPVIAAGEAGALVPSGKDRSDDGRRRAYRDSPPLVERGPNTDAAARRTFVKSGPLQSKGTGYQGSEKILGVDLDAWTARMIEKAKARRKNAGDPDG